jgi:hypothetical protein
MASRSAFRHADDEYLSETLRQDFIEQSLAGAARYPVPAASWYTLYGKVTRTAMLQSFLLLLGVTPYLPLNITPEVQSEIERVLVLGDKPILSRPIPAAVVLEALPKACAREPELCGPVRHYLRIYMRGSGAEYAGIEADATAGANPILPNQHGRGADSHFEVAAGGYWQPNP